MGKTIGDTSAMARGDSSRVQYHVANNKTPGPYRRAHLRFAKRAPFVRSLLQVGAAPVSQGCGITGTNFLPVPSTWCHSGRTNCYVARGTPGTSRWAPCPDNISLMRFKKDLPGV